MYLEMSKEIKDTTVKLAKFSKEIDLGNVNFEYMNNHNFYTVSLVEYKEYWEITHREAMRKTSRADIFHLRFDSEELKYKWSEED